MPRLRRGQDQMGPVSLHPPPLPKHVGRRESDTCPLSSGRTEILLSDAGLDFHLLLLAGTGTGSGSPCLSFPSVKWADPCVLAHSLAAPASPRSGLERQNHTPPQTCVLMTHSPPGGKGALGSVCLHELWWPRACRFLSRKGSKLSLCGWSGLHQPHGGPPRTGAQAGLPESTNRAGGGAGLRSGVSLDPTVTLEFRM